MPNNLENAKMIARTEVGRLIVGLAPKTLANINSQGFGPTPYSIGRKIYYDVENLLTWAKAKGKLTIQQMIEQINNKMIDFYRKKKMLMTKSSDFIENVSVSKLSCFLLNKKDLVNCGVNLNEKKKSPK